MISHKLSRSLVALCCTNSRSSVRSSKGGWGKSHASSKDKHKEYTDSTAAFKGKPVRKCTTCTRLQLVEVRMQHCYLQVVLCHFMLV
jgi:hypothetical protein